MKDSILTKLKSALADGIDSECKVVYLLAECRKLLETYPPYPPPFALKLYLHWALHLNLTHSKTTAEFLERVDGYVGSVLAGNPNLIAEHYMQLEFIRFDTFRKELGAFLGHYKLPTKLCDDDACWQKFVESYCGVIEDGSLTCEGAGLKLIDRVVFARGKRTAPSSLMPFTLVWEVYQHEQKILIVEMGGGTLANGELMMGCTIRLP